MFVKIINFLNKKGYIKENINFTMNIKERGITVGDLLIIFLIILTTTILIKSFKKDKKITQIYSNKENISCKKTLSPKFYLNNLSV